MTNDRVIQINDEVCFFEEQDYIHIKAISPFNAKDDPAELTAEEAIELAEAI